MNAKTCIRLGGGMGFGGDRIDAPRELAESGAIDYLVFDAQSEKSYSMAARRKLQGRPGYDGWFERRLRAVLPACVKRKVKIIDNAGGADVLGAVALIDRVCRDLGIKGLKVAYPLPDSLLDLVRQVNPVVLETGQPVSAFGDRFIGAQAYQGADLIVEGLRRGADFVLTSRTGDSAQFLGPVAYEFGWPLDDWDLVAKGLGVGHLLECSAQVSGGFFADPGLKSVPDMDRMGYPIAEVEPSGDAYITKLPGTGGLVSEATVKEQIVYEIFDPARYYHTDATVDFSDIRVRQVAPNRVKVTGVKGHRKPPTVRICLGVRENYIAVGRMIYGGEGCYERARLAGDIIVKRMQRLYGVDPAALRVDFIGVNALFPWPDVDTSKLREVVVRIAGHFESRETAAELLHEVDTIAGRGPYAPSMGNPIDYSGGPEEVVGVFTAFLPQEAIHFDVHDCVVGV
jgi:hypothetical protein